MSAARPQAESLTASRVLAGTTLALKVAREATDSVSIAKQILGSAAHISEFAEKIQKNRKAMNDLIAKSAEYACHIDTIVAGRIVEGKVLTNLRRLCSVFTRIEALVAEAAAVKNGMKRRFHNIFTAPNKASELSSELEKEIQLFNLAMMLDVRLALSETAVETLRAIHENDLYDSDGFRRLRPADVRKLDNLPIDWWQKHFNVTFAKACVNGELMVIHHPQRLTGSLPSAWVTNLDIVKELSYPRNQHANIVQLYGQSVGDPENAFVAFRSGCHRFIDYVEQRKSEMSLHLKAVKAFETAIKLLDASRHIEHVVDSIWACRGPGTFAVDDECNPTIGLFNDLQHKSEYRRSSSGWHIEWVVFSWFTTHTSQFSVVQDLQVARAIASESNVPNEIAEILKRLQDVCLVARCHSQSMPIDDPSTSLAPATVSHARDHLQSLSQDPITDMLGHFQPRAFILGSQQCKSVWTFGYFPRGRDTPGDFEHVPDYLHLGRCWIENGSRRCEWVSCDLDHVSSVECRTILGYQDRQAGQFKYHSEVGWLPSDQPNVPVGIYWSDILALADAIDGNVPYIPHIF